MQTLRKYRKPTSGAAGVSIRHAGWKALACAIIEQAVYDYRYLEQHGLVAGGKSIDDSRWPTYFDSTRGGQAKQARDGYTCAAMVNELVWFLKSEYLDELLDEINAGASSKTICGVLGIKRGRTMCRAQLEKDKV